MAKATQGQNRAENGPSLLLLWGKATTLHLSLQPLLSLSPFCSNSAGLIWYYLSWNSWAVWLFYMCLSGKTSLVLWKIWELCARPQIIHMDEMKGLFAERLGIRLCLHSAIPKGHLFEFVCNEKNLLLNPLERSFIYSFLSFCLCR